jgi:hypothetical protein
MGELLALLGHERATFQTFRDAPTSERLEWIFHGTEGELAKRLQALNKRGAGVFFMVNRGNEKGRKAENVTGISSYFVDLDGRGVHDYYPLDPTAVVESSPGRFHIYWRIVGAPLEQFAHVQQHLATLLGGDEKVKDLPRVMRLPGYYHNKGEPYLTRLLHGDPVAYDHHDFMDAFALPAFTPKTPMPLAATAYLNRRKSKNHRTLLDRVAHAPEGARNNTLFSMAAAIANDVAAGQVESWEAAEALADAARAGGLDEREIARTIQSAMRYARVAN